MNEGELCEADSTLPNGETNYNVNNCGNYDVFRYTCSSNRVANFRHVGFGGCTGGNWFKIGTARNLEEAKQLMLNHNQCKNEGSMLFYSGYSYSVSWSVRCALAGHHEQCTERNRNWQEYILTYGDSIADYLIGEQGVNSCPSNYVPISEPGLCSTASTALSLTYDASLNDRSSNGVCNLCMGCNPATTRVDNDHGRKAHFICKKRASRRQLAESHVRTELRAKTPSSLERIRKH